MIVNAFNKNVISGKEKHLNFLNILFDTLQKK
jgi:hypothetical protein